MAAAATPRILPAHTRITKMPRSQKKNSHRPPRGNRASAVRMYAANMVLSAMTRPVAIRGCFA